MSVLIRIGGKTQNKTEEAARLAARIELRKKEMMKNLKRDPALAQEISWEIDTMQRELYQRARDANRMDR